MNLEISFDAEGLDKDIEVLQKKTGVEVNYDSEANLDGALICTVVGTAVNVGMFLMQAYSLWGEKRLKKVVTSNMIIEDMPLKKVIEYLNNQNKE